MWSLFGRKLSPEEDAIKRSFTKALAHVDALPGRELTRDQYLEAWRIAGPGMSRAAADDAFDQARRMDPANYAVGMRKSLSDTFKKVIKEPGIAIRIANMR
jgi:AICAR transformylase/IMP cyclohydrolase PurH